MKKIKVIQFGLGPIGIESLKLAADHAWLEVTGGVDIDPAKVGQTLAGLSGMPALGGARVYPSLDALFAAVGGPDLVLHTAGSSAAASFAQMRPALERGISVASTCEELIFPALKTPDLAREFDTLCRRTGARIAATGVNPGFVMEVLPICLTGVSREVRSIYVERVVNASTRRQPLQAKIGSGQDPADFRAKFAAGKAGHAGFQQSVALLAQAMGWRIDEIRESCEPVVATSRVTTQFFDVAPGQSLGIHQKCAGLSGGETKIVFDLQMYLDAPLPHDAIVIKGRPELNLVLNGGVAGDDATVAALINIVPRLLAAAPGVRLMTELPLPAWKNPRSAA
ncbi:MAG: dihydrodipicolinate reductase [Verrucomicrobia bacterium]|nr:dihydrodipicolinate reductase [Verrucomicrobiota bacterium]